MSPNDANNKKKKRRKQSMRVAHGAEQASSTPRMCVLPTLEPEESFIRHVLCQVRETGNMAQKLPQAFREGSSHLLES